MIIATTTVTTEKDAKLIAKRVFADGLARRVHFFPLTTVSHWSREPAETVEYKLVFMVEEGDLPALEKEVRELHRRDAMEWVWWEVDASRDYAALLGHQPK